MSCSAEVPSYQSWVIANRKTLLFRSGTYALSLAHMCEVLAALSILAFLLRSRRLCTRHPFLFNCEHQFSLVQLHYNNPKLPCQHPENRMASRFPSKWRPLFPHSIFVSFLCFLVLNILRKKFFKKFLNHYKIGVLGRYFAPRCDWKGKDEVYSPKQTPAVNRITTLSNFLVAA